MESESTVLGKITKKEVYLNNCEYGYYLNHDSKNYKVPEWFPVDKFNIGIAERLILACWFFFTPLGGHLFLVFN